MSISIINGEVVNGGSWPHWKKPEAPKAPGSEGDKIELEAPKAPVKKADASKAGATKE